MPTRSRDSRSRWANMDIAVMLRIERFKNPFFTESAPIRSFIAPDEDEFDYNPWICSRRCRASWHRWPPPQRHRCDRGGPAIADARENAARTTGGVGDDGPAGVRSARGQPLDGCARARTRIAILAAGCSDLGLWTAMHKLNGAGTPAQAAAQNAMQFLRHDTGVAILQGEPAPSAASGRNHFVARCLGLVIDHPAREIPCPALRHRRPARGV